MSNESKSLFLVVMSVMFCFATSLVFAETYNWVGGSTTGDPNLWNVADNWSPAGLPTIANSDTVNLLGPDAPLIDNTMTAECYRMYGPQNSTGSETCVMQVTGGIFDLYDWRFNDNASHGSGEVQMSGGTVSITRDHLHLGYRGEAIFTISGGTFNVIRDMYIAENGTATGTLNMSGGTVNVDGTISVGTRGKGYLNMTGGTLNTTILSQSDIADAGLGSEVVMDGGDINVDRYMRIGRRGPGTWIMNGGTITLGEALVIGEDDSLGNGYLEINGGTIIFGRDGYTDLLINSNNGSFVNMTGTGMMVIRGDATGYVNDLVNADLLVAYGGTGTVDIEYVLELNVTTVRAVHMFNPNPSDGANVSSGSCTLQWTLPEPNSIGEVVTCDVVFGTEPNMLLNTKIVDAEAVESVGVTLATNEEYYWQIKTYSDGLDYIEGPVFTLNTYNLAPDVDAGDGDTWLPESGPRQYTMSPFVSDDGRVAPLTYEWTIVSDANDLNPSSILDPYVKNAVVELKEMGDYELQVEVYDGEYTVSDTALITVYPDACTHAVAQPGYEWLAADLNRDCVVDMLDFAQFAAAWLDYSYSEE